jgi:hypothetical protein
MATLANSDLGPPRRIPKLTYRNRISDGSLPTIDSNSTSLSSPNSLSGSNSTMEVASVASVGFGNDSIKSSLDSGRDQDAATIASGKISNSSSRQSDSIPRNGSRPSTARTSSYKSTASDDKSVKKKKGSMFEFLAVKEPSSRALADFAEQQRKQNAAKGNRSMTTLPGVSSQKLPINIPRVNSKWDGMPKHSRESEAAKARRMASPGAQNQTLGRSLMSQSQTSLPRSVGTISTRLGNGGPGSLTFSLASLDDSSSIRTITTDSSNTTDVTASKDHDASKPTPNAVKGRKLSNLKTPSMPFLQKPNDYISPELLLMMDAPGFPSIVSPYRHDVKEPEPGMQAVGKINSKTEQVKPGVSKSNSFRSLHSPSGSQDAHIHPALRPSGVLYESESSSSSEEGLDKQTSNSTQSAEPSEHLPNEQLAQHQSSLLVADLQQRLSRADSEMSAHNWPLPSPNPEPKTHHQAATGSVTPTMPPKSEQTKNDSGVSVEAADRATKRLLGKGTTINFSRREGVSKIVHPELKHRRSSEQALSTENIASPVGLNQQSDEIDLAIEDAYRSSILDNVGPGDYEQTIHLGIGFDTSDLASIAESQAPSEMSARWFQPTKERLGLGSRFMKRDPSPWNPDDEESGEKRRRSMRIFNRG